MRQIFPVLLPVLALSSFLAAPPLVAAAPRCQADWETSPPPADGNRLACTDGDPTCDSGSDPNSCTFRVSLCLNADHPNQPACSPSDVAGVRVVPGPIHGDSDIANQDSLYDALAGMGANTDGVCGNPGPNEGAACAMSSDCDSPGETDGRCDRTAIFDPALHGTNQCSGAATITVPLRSGSNGYVRGSRRLRVRLDNGRSSSTLNLVCHKAAPLPPGVYDVDSTTGGEPQAYVPTVDQFTIRSFSVQADHGGPLTIGHPVEMRAEVDLQAEPFHAMVWYGLQDDAGNHCLIDHIELDHLEAMFDAATKANLATEAQDDGIVQPSLTDCSSNRDCVEPGEECLGFRRTVPIGPQPTPPDTDPTVTIPEVVDPGLPPSEVDTEIVTTWLCSTREYAAAEVVRTHSQPKWLTPADLAGSVEQTHLLGSTDDLPASCAPLIGAGNVTAWMAFDPQGTTNFLMRPTFTPPTPDPDADPDAETEMANEEISAYLQRLGTTTPVDGVRDDGGLDVDLRHLEIGSSVVLVDRDDRPGGDMHVDAQFSLDGTPTPDQQSALPGGEVNFHFTFQPVGDPREGCVPPPSATYDAMPLQVVHNNPDHTGDDVDEEPAADLTLGVAHDQSFPLYLPPAVRAKVYGEWSCWDQFDVEGCLTTNLPQSSQFGTGDDCGTTGVVVLRDAPPDGAEIEAPPAELLAATLSQRIGTPACSDSLFQQYADLMKKYYELSNSVQISDYYQTDYMTWVWGSIIGDNTSLGFTYFTDDARRRGYYAHIKAYLDECESRGGVRCWETWGYRHSPWNIDIANYQRYTIPYFLDPWTMKGTYANFKADPQAGTRSSFNFECSGIASGAVCSQINYDLNRVPELASSIRNVLVNRQLTSPLAAKISPHGVGRCLLRTYPSLYRINVDANGVPTRVPDDDIFYTDYLRQVCEKGRYKAQADAVWNQIVNSCTYVSKPFADSGVGIYAGRFVKDLYGTYDTGYKLGLRGVVEGGIVNDYIVATPLQQFKLIFGAQGRIYMESDPYDPVVGGWLNVYDIFKTWMLANIYSDVLSSNVEGGFHVLTNDIWKISFKIPTGEFQLPDPPALTKEKEKCKYLWKFPMPFRVEICGSVGGRVDLTVTAKLLKNGLAGVDPNKVDWPGMAGTITPGAQITNSGRAGVDVLVASAGLAVVIDPTIGIYLPVEVGAKWNLAMPTTRLLNFTMAPYVKVAMEMKALGGSLNGYTRWKFGNSGDELYPLITWEPLDIGGLAGKEWVIVKHDWDISGSKAF